MERGEGAIGCIWLTDGGQTMIHQIGKSRLRKPQKKIFLFKTHKMDLKHILLILQEIKPGHFHSDIKQIYYVINRPGLAGAVL